MAAATSLQMHLQHSPRKKNFGYEETIRLLELWTHYTNGGTHPELGKGHRTGRLWLVISERMKAMNYNRGPEECKVRVGNLRAKYTKLKRGYLAGDLTSLNSRGYFSAFRHLYSLSSLWSPIRSTLSQPTIPLCLLLPVSVSCQHPASSFQCSITLQHHFSPARPSSSVLCDRCHNLWPPQRVTVLWQLNSSTVRHSVILTEVAVSWNLGRLQHKSWAGFVYHVLFVHAHNEKWKCLTTVVLMLASCFGFPRWRSSRLAILPSPSQILRG